MSGVPFAYGAPTTATAARVLSVCCVEKPESTAPPFLPVGEFRSGGDGALLLHVAAGLLCARLPLHLCPFAQTRMI